VQLLRRRERPAHRQHALDNIFLTGLPQDLTDEQVSQLTQAAVNN
jgi:hypothetical protein